MNEKESHSKWLYQCIFPNIEKFNKGELVQVPDYGNTLYNYLETKFINFSLERKKKIKEEAIEVLLSEMRVEKRTDQNNRMRIDKVIEYIKSGSKETEGLIRTRAKKIALNTFLSECKEMDRDIISEIKEYEK